MGVIINNRVPKTGEQDDMQVTISKAAEMVGVTRATFYRHIERKNISVHKDEDGNPKVDVSELIRVYGDRVQYSTLQADNTSQRQSYTALNGAGEAVSASNLTGSLSSADLNILRERIRNLEEEKGRVNEERDRERRQLSEQIEMLRETVSKSEEQQKRLTLLLTDQREGQEKAQEKKMEELEKTIQLLRRQNRVILNDLKTRQEQGQKSFWKKLFG